MALRAALRKAVVGSACRRRRRSVIGAEKNPRTDDISFQPLDCHTSTLSYIAARTRRSMVGWPDPRCRSLRVRLRPACPHSVRCALPRSLCLEFPGSGEWLSRVMEADAALGRNALECYAVVRACFSRMTSCCYRHFLAEFVVSSGASIVLPARWNKMGPR